MIDLPWVRAAACAALLLAAGCTKTVATPPDAGPAITCAESAPCPLTSGTAVTGSILALAQNNLYTIELPASAAGKRTLVKVQLVNAAPVSPVRLALFVEAPDGQSQLATRFPAPGSGPQALSVNVLLPGPGAYRLRVRDSDATHVDKNNPYTLTATLIDDPDPGEPDDLPAQARAIAPGAAGAALAQASGFIATAGDRDLLGFDVATAGLVRMTVQQAALAGSPLRLRARLLKRDTATPDDFSKATAVIDVQATAAGAGMVSDLIRFVTAGRYLVALEDAAGTESDERAQAQWTVGLGLVADPDPNEQGTRNDTPATATPLVLPGVGTPVSKEGAIGSQGDVDWFQIDVPASAVPQILEVRFDPMLAAATLKLNLAVGTAVAAPSAPCDFTCAVTAFCAPGAADGGSFCAYTPHLIHHFALGESAAQVVRIRHLGAAETVRVEIDDQGGLDRSTDHYQITATLLAEPDANEATVLNDDPATPTPAPPVAEDAGAFHGGGSGKISWWDFLDGKTTAELAADVDWYRLDLPPRSPAPACPTDGGPQATPDGGGPCGPDPADGGPLFLPRPDYGLTMRWSGPADGKYKIGFWGVVPVDGGSGSACMFSFDEQFARDTGGGSYALGEADGGLCFCLAAPNAESDKLWVRVEGAHRPTPPGQNSYSDQPYNFSLGFTPGVPSSCDAGCAATTRAWKHGYSCKLEDQP